MLVKIKNQIFEVSEIAADVISDDDYVIQALFKATSCILNEYKQIVNLNTEDIIELYQKALSCAKRDIVIRKYIQREILDLD
jgi:hypothetical protein